jgi:CYTH domain-containing protein
VPHEIERKFLVKSDAYRAQGTSTHTRQGYVRTAGTATVRVRIAGGRGYLTLKGPSAPGGLTRSEFEYEIPVEDARALLDTLCERPQIEKLRWRVPAGAHTWEVDEFLGENAGLVVAEIELSAEDEPFERPAWLGEEVTADPRYRNSALARRPFGTW